MSLIPRDNALGSSAEHHEASQAFRALRKLAHRKIQSLPFDTVGGQWLRLYVDATVGSVLSETITPKEDYHRVSQSIKALDMAIIVAGATGREDQIQLLIRVLQDGRFRQASEDIQKKTQQEKSSRGNPSAYGRPSKRQCMLDHAGASGRQPIPCLEKPPTMTQFIAHERNKPFILRRYIAESDEISNPYGLSWPAVDEWKSMDYLLELVGEDRVVPVEIGSSYTDAAWTQTIVPFRAFLESVGYRQFDCQADDPATQRTDAPMYLAQYSLLKQFPELERDIVMPDYVFSAPPAPDCFPGYKPPGNEEELVINVWVGSGQGKVTSPPHTVSRVDGETTMNCRAEGDIIPSGQDPYYNCYAQVLGRKRVWLAPPSIGPYMYAHGGCPNDEAEVYATNTSQVPVFELSSSDRTKYPHFFEQVEAECMEEILEPGDMLFMPPGWWHAMRGEGTTFAWSVSMWF